MGAPRVSTALFGREKTKHSRQGPGKRSLPGQKDKAPGKRSLPGQGGKAPARGACRAKEARPGQEELAGTTEPKHRDPGKWSLPGRPFQAQGYFTNTRP